MMQQDELELIQAGVDGELDASGQAQLEALLAGSAEAREQHAALQNMTRFLERVPPVEPPSDLHGRIVGAVKLPKAPFWQRFQQVPGFLRYGLAATAAVVVTIGVYQTGSQLEGAEYEQLVGTIATRGAELDRFDFEQPSMQGNVRLLERKGTLALEFDLQADGSLRFDVDFVNSGLRFDAFTQDDLNLEEISFTKTTLSARTEGSQRFMVLMRRDDSPLAADAHIDLTLSRDGETLEKGRLTASGR